MSEVIHLFPFDQAVAGIGEDQCYDRCPLSQCRLIFLAVHHKSAIPGDCQHFFLRIDQLGRNGSRNSNSHGSKSIRNDTGIWFVAVVLSGDPHFMSTHIRDYNIIRTHEFPHIMQYFLGLHGKRSILRLAFILCHHFGPQLQKFFRFFLRIATILNLL